jgi:hypothetical protein
MTSTNPAVAILLATLLASCASVRSERDLTTSADALDVVITTYVMSWGEQVPELDPIEDARLQALYDRRISNTFRFEGVTPVDSTDGSLFQLDDQSSFWVRLGGGLRAEVKLSEGVFGVQGGRVFVADGSLASVNGLDLVFFGGRWRER